MALPIKPTPILKGKEAQDFLNQVDNPKIKAASKKEILEGKKIFDSVVGRKAKTTKNET